MKQRRHEIFLALITLALGLGMGVTNDAFLSFDNLFDLVRASVVVGLLALGATFALVSGGIDVSFTVVATFSFYATTRLLIAAGGEGNAALAFLISGSIGLLLGAVNASIISFFRLPALIVTLGTMSLFRGFMLTFIGSEYVTELPPGILEFSRLNLWEGATPDGGAYRLPLVVLLLPAAAVLSTFFLRRTLAGRGIQAMGGSLQAAERFGFNVPALQFLVYGFIGLLAGTAGMAHVCLVRFANPFDLVGSELNVIAAVVLGGASLAGGRGTITGSLLGVVLVVIISNNLILLGVPPHWQKVVVGLLILLGTGIPALSERFRARLRRET